VYGHHNRVSGTNAEAYGDYCAVVGTNSECTGRHGSATGTNAEYHDRDAKLHKHPPPVAAAPKGEERERDGPDGRARKRAAVTHIDHSDGLLITGNMSGCRVTYPDHGPTAPPPPTPAPPDDTDLVQFTPTGKDEMAAAGEPTCPVCLDNKRQLAAVECGHLFCYGCVQKLLGAKDKPGLACPTCRGPIRRRMIKIFA
jgi:hypothetical protein